MKPAPLLATAQILGGIAFLCLMDALVKYLAIRHGVPLTTFARYAAGTAIALPLWWLQGRPPLHRDGWRLHLLRGALIAVMALSFFWSITRLPLALVITITFIAPLLIPPLAALFLGERLQPRLLLAGGIGFAGVIVAAGGLPDLAGAQLLPVLAALFAAVCYAASSVVLRARAARDGATAITLAGAAVPMVLLLPLGVGAPMPTAIDVAWFAALGLVGNIGVQLLARGYAHVQAQAAAVMEFTALPWAALFGWAIFAEPVAPTTAAGAVIIAIAVWAANRPQPAP